MIFRHVFLFNGIKILGLPPGKYLTNGMAKCTQVITWWDNITIIRRCGEQKSIIQGVTKKFPRLGNPKSNAICIETKASSSTHKGSLLQMFRPNSSF